MTQILDKIQLWGLVFLVFLIPVFFLPTTTDFFDFQKLVLLVCGVSILFLVWAFRGLVARDMVFYTTPLDIPVLLFTFAFLISTFVRTPNKMDAFLVPGTMTMILALALFYFLVVQTIRLGSKHFGKAEEPLVYALLGSGLVVVLVSIWVSLGIVSGITQIPSFLRTPNFSLLGAPFPTIAFLLVLIPIVLDKISQNRRDKTLSFFYITLLAVFVIGLAAIFLQINRGGNQIRFLPLSSGWAVAVETLKVSPLGVGPGNFLQAFNANRPRAYNDTDLWNVRFATSSNWYLDVFTQAGFLGLAAIVFLILAIVRFSRKKFKSSRRLFDALPIFILIILLLVPGSFILLFLLYLVLALVVADDAREHSVALVSKSHGQEVAFLPFFILLVVLAINLLIFTQGGKAYAAEVIYKQGLDAAAKNDAQGLVNNLNSAINMNPYVARYHITASQAVLTIANSVAKSGEINEEKRKQISQLVQESIRQAQLAVAINKQSSISWENLGNIYRALITVAKGSDEWAVLSLNQAISLESVNPILRVELGGVYYQLAKYEDAARAFELAVAAKPDWANAHYNLALALRDKGDTAGAIAQLEKTLTLVKPESKDYQTIQAELEKLKSKLPAKNTTGGSGETIQAPQPSSSPALNPQLELPAEAAPSGSSASPSPSPSPKP